MRHAEDVDVQTDAEQSERPGDDLFPGQQIDVRDAAYHGNELDHL